jgi:hypothetical protein
VQDKNKRLTRISSIIGGSFAAIWFSFDEYCFQTAPRFPIEEVGRIYSMNHHGTFIYLTKAEYFTWYGIPACFLLLGITSAILMKYKIIRI